MQAGSFFIVLLSWTLLPSPGYATQLNARDEQECLGIKGYCYTGEYCNSPYPNVGTCGGGTLCCLPFGG